MHIRLMPPDALRLTPATADGAKLRQKAKDAHAYCQKVFKKK